MTTTWDAAFEAIPADTDEAKYGADGIRDLKVAVSERGELEHNFKTGTQPFHKGGKCSVLFIGNTAAIAALTGMGGGAANATLAWDTTLKVLKEYNGSAWVTLDIDHGLLSGLTDDDHTQYLNLTKASQELTQSLTVTALKTIDGRDISVDGTRLDLCHGVKWLATPANKVAWTAAATWTDVDISANTGTDTAVAAIIAAEMRLACSGSSHYASYMGTFRKNGSAITSYLPRIRAVASYDYNSALGAIPGEASGMFIVEVDGSEVFEAKFELVSDSVPAYSTLVFNVDLVGYII